MRIERSLVFVNGIIDWKNKGPATLWVDDIVAYWFDADWATLHGTQQKGLISENVTLRRL